MGVWANIKKIFYTENDDYVNDIEDVLESELQPDMSQTVIEVLKNEEAKLEPVSLGKKPTVSEVKSYIDSNCGRMSTVKQQNKGLRREYEKVTGYLKDIELIEEMDSDKKNALISVASEIVELERQQKKVRKQSQKITETNYKTMQQYEDIMNKELTSMKKKEKFQLDIKSDMRHLEGEKAGLLYEKKERYSRHSYFKTISIGLSVMIISLFIFLLIVAMYSEADMTIPFIIVIAVSGLLILYIFMGVRKNRYGMALVNRKLNKAINLMNSVKIKYINNTALLDYLYGKYGVKSADELEYVWGHYLRIRAEEEKNQADRERIDELEKELKEMLNSEGIHDTNVWSSQVVAIIESREMVEVRHKLNVRRGKLREQIAYNDEMFSQSAGLLSALMADTPEYDKLVREGVEKYKVSDDFYEFLQ